MSQLPDHTAEMILEDARLAARALDLASFLDYDDRHLIIPVDRPDRNGTYLVTVRADAQQHVVTVAVGVAVVPTDRLVPVAVALARLNATRPFVSAGITERGLLTLHLSLDVDDSETRPWRLGLALMRLLDALAQSHVPSRALLDPDATPDSPRAPAESTQRNGCPASYHRADA